MGETVGIDLTSDEMEEFINSRGWKEMEKFIRGRLEQVRLTLEGLTDINEIMKYLGRIDALRYVLGLPEGLLNELREEEEDNVGK